MANNPKEPQRFPRRGNKYVVRVALDIEEALFLEQAADQDHQTVTMVVRLALQHYKQQRAESQYRGPG